MRNFNPNGREGIIDYSDEEFDEVEDILLALGDLSDNINNFNDNQQIIMFNNEETTTSSDEEYFNEGADSGDTLDTSGSSTDEPEERDTNMEAEPGNQTTREQPSTSSGEKRVLVDFDENDVEDEVVRRIIAEKKKPRSKPPNITTDDFPTDLSFHPDQNILAISTVTGDVIIYRYTNEENTLLQTHEIHKKSIRDIEFSTDGRCIISGSRDKSIIISDFETGKFKRFWDDAHSEPIYTLTVIDENLIASGDDDGTVRLWDVRERGSEPVFSLKEVEDYISCIITNNQKKLLVCTSGDGYMTTINIASKKMYVQSEPYEEELTCAGIYRNESKLVVGSSKGNFYTFNWGEFGFHNDAFTGPPSPISHMIPITERIAVTAGEEGVVRAMHLVPGRMLGVVGHHSLAVEAMDICNDGEFIASSSHDNDIRFWNIKYFENFDGINYNSKPSKSAMQHNLPSSLRANRADFFADLS